MIIPDIPTDAELVENRNKVIFREQSLFEEVKNSTGKLCLNLGCGARLLQGFHNIDKYFKDPNVLNYDIHELPYYENSVDIIFCAHALEHLPIRHAKQAIRKWGKLLATGGKAYVGIPDIGIIMSKMLNPATSHDDKLIFLYTLFGLQTDPSNNDFSRVDYPLDPGQFHTSGFSKDTIQEEFAIAGLDIIDIMNYDGWGTPSVWVVGVRNR